MKRLHFFFFAAIALGIMEGFYYYPLLPEQMAVHFGASGAADRWGTKDSFFQTMGIVFAIMVIFAGALPLLLRVMPTSLINMPNKDYWFAPERREATMSGLTRQMLFFGTIILLFLDVVIYLSLQANYSGTYLINAGLFWSAIAALAIISIVWAVSFLRNYRRPGV